MSVEAKQVMLKSLEKQLGQNLTANVVDEVLKTVADQLDLYSLESIDEDTLDYSSNDILESFLTAKQLEGRSEKTLTRYKYILTKLLAFAKTPVRSITVYHLRRFLMDMKQRGNADSTIEGTREIFSSFFNWCQKEALIENNPCSNLAPIKCQKKERLPFTNAEIEQLKEACTTSRDKAIICFLLSTGCRISEVTELNRTDVNLKGLQCKVLGKGNKERIVYIDDITALVLQRYFSERTDDLEPLFLGRFNKRLQPGGIRHMLIKLGARAGVNNVHPHRFRRTLATNLIHRGMPIQEVARILGHDKIDTTMKYVYINKVELKSSYNKYNG